MQGPVIVHQDEETQTLQTSLRISIRSSDQNIRMVLWRAIHAHGS